MSVYGDKAEGLFREGYNCAQAVLCAFEDITGLNKETASKEVILPITFRPKKTIML